MRFTLIYSTRWTKEHASAECMRLCKYEWAREKTLETITAVELRLAIDHCKSHHEWPPLIPEFVKIVRLVRKEIERAREWEMVKSGRYFARNDVCPRAQLRRDITKQLKEKYPHKRFIDLIPMIQAEIDKELKHAN